MSSVRSYFGLKPDVPIDEEHENLEYHDLLWSRVRLSLREGNRSRCSSSSKYQRNNLAWWYWWWHISVDFLGVRLFSRAIHFHPWILMASCRRGLGVYMSQEAPEVF